MRRSWLIPALTLLISIEGAFLRHKELNTVFEEATGLPEKNAPATILLIVLSAAAMLFAAGCAMGNKTGKQKILYNRAFKTNTFPDYVISVIPGAVMLASGVMFYFNDRSGEITSVIFAGLAAVAGICMIVMAWSSFTGKCESGTRLASLVPSLFLGFWLAMVYKDNATSPIIIEYGVKCIALAATAICFYYSAGYAFGRDKPGLTIAFHIAASYFVTVTLADEWSNTEKLMLAAVLMFTLLNLEKLLTGLKAGERKNKSEISDPETE